MLKCKVLPRCLAIAEVGNKGEDEVWQPRCEQWRKVRLDGKGGRNCLKHDVAETERQS